MPARRALAPIEVVTALPVLVVLAGLLLPAALAFRRAAERQACVNNLKEVGLAAHAFEAADGRLPPSDVRIAGQHKSWVVYLLPHLGQPDLAAKYAFNKDWFDPTNQPLVGTPLPVLKCPTAPVRDIHVTGVEGTTFRAAACDYAAHVSLEPDLYSSGVLPAGQSSDGMFTWLRIPDRPDGARTRLADCTDGLSNTLMFSEMAGRPQHWRAGIRQREDQTTVPPRARGAWAASVASVSIQPIGHSRDGKTQPGPCAVNCRNDRGIYAFHPGVANGCFGDGSVRPLSVRLDVFVLYALSTSRGGETLAVGDYSNH
jgi:prepilin-type processing-associated H-X9-DG protein